MKCLRLGIFLVSFGTPQKLEVVMNSRMGLTSTATNLTNITKQYLSSKLDQLKKMDLTTIATALSNLTKYYYGHEIVGLEKIPREGAALLVYYHGVLPVDYVALVARLYLRKPSK